MSQTNAVHPPYHYPPYTSSVLRSPRLPVIKDQRAVQGFPSPLFLKEQPGLVDNDLTKNARKNGEPIGERIKVFGTVKDLKGNPLPDVLIEIWQANAAGRYIHKVDVHDAPLDPNFSGCGRTLTDKNGAYHFYTIRPGAYPWKNHVNAWRPHHIHFSLIGHHLPHRLITQMYFPDDPLQQFDPIFQSVPPQFRSLLISTFKMEQTEPDYALSFEFNIILTGKDI